MICARGNGGSVGGIRGSRDGRGLIELVAEYRHVRRRGMHLDPFPSGISDELIAPEILRRPFGLIVVRGRVKLEQSIGVVSEAAVDQLDIVLSRRVLLAKKCVEVSLVGVPSG